jgi:hypothetical protein
MNAALFWDSLPEEVFSVHVFHLQVKEVLALRCLSL